MTLGKLDSEKICANCGESYICTHGHRKYCRPCSKKVANAQSLSNYYKRMGELPLLQRICPYCNKPFATKLKVKKYCLPEHKLMAEQAKKRTPEGRAKARRDYPKYKIRLFEKEKIAKGWTAKEQKQYASQYYYEVIKPRLQAQKEAQEIEIKQEGFHPVAIQHMTPEHISKYWNRLI